MMQSQAESPARKPSGRPKLAVLKQGRLDSASRKLVTRILRGDWELLDQAFNYPRPGVVDKMDPATLIKGMSVAFGAIFAGIYIAETNFVLVIIFICLCVLAMVWMVVRGGTASPSRSFFRALGVDLRAGRVEQADAVVGVSGARYVSNVSGRSLVMTSASSKTLRKTLRPHRAYYLPRSGLVLAVEPTIGATGYRTSAARDERGVDLEVVRTALAKAHGFNEAWYAANRLGELARGQWVTAARARLTGSGKLLLCSATVLALVEGLASFPDDRMRGENVQFQLAVILVGVPTSILIVRAIALAIALIRHAGKLAVFEGEVRLEEQWDFGRKNMELYVFNDVRVRIPGEAKWLHVDGVHYRVYYLPGTDVLVGIEPVSMASSAAVAR